MIYTVTLNPALDYLVSSRDFAPGKINRYEDCICRPGGKGINVSLLLSSLGVETTALGLAAGFTGREVARLAEEAGCKTDFLFLPQGHTRINIKVSSDGETDLNGVGPQVPEGYGERLGEKLSSLRAGDGLVLAGSVPPTMPPQIYAQLLDRVKDRELLTVVDTTGPSLLGTLPYRPFLIKPNLEELGELFGLELTDREGACQCARQLQSMGARNVAVSMGGKGALLVCEDGRQLFCHAVKGETVSTVGAGDSMVAGFLYGWKLHGTLEGALKWGAAAGAATAFSSGIAPGELVKKLYLQVGNIYPV